MRLIRLLALLSVSGVHAQFEVIGSDICHCQPDSYSFRFDLSNSCLSSTVLVAPGIEDVLCSSEGAAKMLTSIDSVEIFELDSTSQAISSVQITGPFRNGDSVSYSAIASASWSSFTAKNIPKGIRAVINASDGNGQQRSNSWTIIFDGDCGGTSI